MGHNLLPSQHTMDVTPVLIALPDLTNPVTSWVVLALVSAGWLTAYLFVSSGSRL